VGPAARELVGSEVDERVARSVQRVLEWSADADVRLHVEAVGGDERGLGTECPPDEQPAECAAGVARLRVESRHQGWDLRPVGGWLRVAGLCDRECRCLGQCPGWLCAHGRDVCGFRPEKPDDDRRLGLCDGFEHCRSGRRLGRLRDDDDDLGRRVGIEQFDGLSCRGSVDCVLEVAPAGSDGLRDAGPGAVDQRRYLLQAGPRGRDDADGTAVELVCESERESVEQRGPTVRTHHELVVRAAERLEVSLGLDWDVIGKNLDVQAGVQRQPRLADGVRARHRDERHGGVVGPLDRRRQRRRRLARSVGVAAVAARECLAHRGDASLCALALGRDSHENQVVWADSRQRPGIECRQVSQLRSVCLGAHQRERVRQVVAVGSLVCDTHQFDRITVHAVENGVVNCHDGSRYLSTRGGPGPAYR
jgi:hypothetical protein